MYLCVLVFAGVWDTFDMPLLLQVSVYELQEHLDYNYRLGDVVLRLSEGILPGMEASPPEPGYREDRTDGNAEAEAEATRPPLAASVGTAAAADQEDALSWVGEIVGLQNGKIRVLWADGQSSSVSPQMVFVVGSPSFTRVASVPFLRARHLQYVLEGVKNSFSLASIPGN
jgi:hypothetical protein